MTFSLKCEEPSRYCIEYRNGTLHDVLTFELIVVASAAFAICGYIRASALSDSEREEDQSSDTVSGGDDNDEGQNGSASQRLLEDSSDVQVTDSKHED